MLDPNRLAVEAFFDYFMDNYHPYNGKSIEITQEIGEALEKGFKAGYYVGWKEREETLPK